MTVARLDQLTLAWEVWAAEPVAISRKVARARLHLLFLLVRFGALRMVEALNLDLRRDLDCQSGMIRIGGAYSRNVLLPLYAMRPIRRIAGMSDSPDFLRLDPGFARRTFYSVAGPLGIPPALAGPRALRYLRGRELLEMHVPLKVVQDYLGLVRPAQIEAFLKFGGEAPEKIGNTFAGVIAGIETGLRSALVMVDAFAGFSLASLLDKRALAALDPAPGLVVRAAVEQGMILLGHPGSQSVFCNSLAARLVSFYPDPVESFVALELPGKEMLRADLETARLAKLDLEPGREILAMFPARAVKLALA